MASQLSFAGVYVFICSVQRGGYGVDMNMISSMAAAHNLSTEVHTLGFSKFSQSQAISMTAQIVHYYIRER